MSNPNWLDLSGTSNRYVQMYVKGFVDVSGGNITLRPGPTNNNHLIVQGGDISLNGRLFVSADASLNGNAVISKLLTANGGVTVPTGQTLTVAAGGTATLSGTTNTAAVASSGLITANAGVTVPSGQKLIVGTGASTADNAVAVAGNVGITGNLSVGGNLSIFQFTANKTITTTNYQLVVAEDISLNGRVIGSSDASFGGNLWVGGQINSNAGGVSFTANNASYIQYGSTTAYPTNRFNTIAAGDGVNSVLNGDGGKYVAGQGLTLTGQSLSWGSENSYASQIQIDGGRSVLAHVNHGQIRFYTANTQQMTINESGAVGIGTTNPFGKLHIYESTGTGDSGGAASGSLVIEHGNNGGSSSIIFPSRNNYTSDYGYIRYRDDETNAGGTAERSRLEIGTENDFGYNTYSDALILQKNGGYVGVGTTNPQSTLDVSGSIRSSGSLSIGGDASFGGNLTVAAGGTATLSGTTNTAAVASSGLITANAGVTVPSGQKLIVGTGASTADNAVAVAGNVGITGNLSVGGNLSIFQFTANKTITTTNYQLVVAEDLSLNGNLVTNGSITSKNGLSVTAGTLSFPTSSVTNAMLQYSSMTIAGTSVSLGGSIAQSTICSGYATTASPTFSGKTTFPGSTTINSSGYVGIGTASPNYSTQTPGVINGGGFFTKSGRTSINNPIYTFSCPGIAQIYAIGSGNRYFFGVAWWVGNITSSLVTTFASADFILYWSGSTIYVGGNHPSDKIHYNVMFYPTYDSVGGAIQNSLSY